MDKVWNLDDEKVLKLMSKLHEHNAWKFSKSYQGKKIFSHCFTFENWKKVLISYHAKMAPASQNICLRNHFTKLNELFCILDYS